MPLSGRPREAGGGEGICCRQVTLRSCFTSGAGLTLPREFSSGNVAVMLQLTEDQRRGLASQAHLYVDTMSGLENPENKQGLY